MNLRDQLLKAGLANKKQAKKAKNEARRAQAEKTKQERKGQKSTDEIEQAAQKKIARQKQKDKEKNIALTEKRKEQEKKAQIVDLILSHDQQGAEGRSEVIYYFIGLEQTIHSILVSESQQKSLAKGRLGIVSGGPLDEEFHLLPLLQIDKLRRLDDSLIICHHNPETTSSHDN